MESIALWFLLSIENHSYLLGNTEGIIVGSQGITFLDRGLAYDIELFTKQYIPEYIM